MTRGSNSLLQETTPKALENYLQALSGTEALIPPCATKPPRKRAASPAGLTGDATAAGNK